MRLIRRVLGRVRATARRLTGVALRRATRLSPRLREAEVAMREGDPERALSLMSGNVEASSVANGRMARAVGRFGDRLAMTATRFAMRSSRRWPVLDVAERRISGHITETDPRWSPRVPGPAEPLAGTEPRRVIQILKESRPYRQSGYTMRSSYNVATVRDAGWDPVVMTPLGFPRSRTGKGGPAVEVIDGIRHHRLDAGPAYPMDGPADVYLEDFAWCAADVIREERPEIIHVSSGFRGYELALVALALGRHFDVPVVYEVRGLFDAPAHAAGFERYKRRAATEVRTMLAADAVVTLAETMRADIIERGVPPERVFVVPNGVDPEAFAPQPPDAAIRERYDLRDRFVIGYISNLDHPREDHESLIGATARLVAAGRDVACLIVGDGTRREQLERAARASGAGDRVVFTGQIPHEDVRAMYATIDVFIVPRRDERAARLVTPLKPYEAMAMARPLVVADLPALTEIAPDGVRSLSYPTADAAGLADAVARLMDDPALAARIAAAGREWVAAERTWAANEPRWDAVYRSVLAGRGVAA
jgi:glycosyltransferase involved in cell wall biosynthesis